MEYRPQLDMAEKGINKKRQNRSLSQHEMLFLPKKLLYLTRKRKRQNIKGREQETIL